MHHEPSGHIGKTQGEFSVCQFFPNGSYEYIARYVGAEEAVEVARSYTRPTRPGIIMGIIARVIVTDGGDFTCFEWKNGEGVTFPPEAKGKV
jgi:hypothetical protein